MKNSGFPALPGGLRNHWGDFIYQGGDGYWWSASEIDAYYAFHRNLGCFNDELYRIGYNKSYGYSVRLVRDN